MICNNCVETINKIHVFATMALNTQEKFFKSAVTSNNNENKFLGNCGLLLSYLMQVNLIYLTHKLLKSTSQYFFLKLISYITILFKLILLIIPKG